MSKISLSRAEIQILISAGWQEFRLQGDYELTMEVGTREIVISPVLMRLLKPMRFRSQARLYDLEYSELARKIGWGGNLALPGSLPNSKSNFLIEKFNLDFVVEFTKILKEYMLNVDLKEIVANSVESRKEVRRALSKADFIDYAFLGRTRELESVLLEEDDQNSEFLAIGENPSFLAKAIEMSKSREAYYLKRNNRGHPHLDLDCQN